MLLLSQILTEKLEGSLILFSFIGNPSSLFFQEGCLLEKFLLDRSFCLSCLLIINGLYIYIFKYGNRSLYNSGIFASISFVIFSPESFVIHRLALWTLSMASITFS